MKEFIKGDKVKLTDGRTAEIVSKIGDGGQGIVYKVKSDGKTYALKWYSSPFLKGLEPTCIPFYKNLRKNVQTGAPSDAFLWPLSIAVTGKQSHGFGYLMELRPSQYAEFTKFLKAKEHFESTEAVINAAVSIVEAFKALHRKGLSYQDLSPGNFFIDKRTGDVLICDNDNVVPNGESFGISGTPGFIAPEVILGKAVPNRDTDFFSLAVILFELFFLSHPLEGANCCRYPCLTKKIERELYAEKPVFVCNRNDTSNAPVRGLCSNLLAFWPVYPRYLHDAFHDAFTDGLKNPSKRLSETEWLSVLYRLADDIVVCPHCGEVNFASMAKGGTITCTYNRCRSQYAAPFKIKGIGGCIYPQEGFTVSEYHLSKGSREAVIGTFVKSKLNAGVYGLRNDCAFSWAVEYPNSVPKTYAPGTVVTVTPNTKIIVGTKELHICMP